MKDLIALALLPLYCYGTFKAGMWYWNWSKEQGALAQVTGRTLVMAVTWGVGIIGTEGFGLPGPIVLGTLAMLAWPGQPNYGIIFQTWLFSIVVAFLASLIALAKYGLTGRRDR